MSSITWYYFETNLIGVDPIAGKCHRKFVEFRPYVKYNKITGFYVVKANMESIDRMDKGRE